MIIHGESIEELRKLPDNSIDAVITDPPYGLSNTDPTHVAEAITQWVTGNREYVPPVKGGGFMGKDWDSFVPPVAVWDECLRVLKPGGYLLSFAGSRTVDLMTLGIRLAGFDIRDSIAWLYGSGFPKSQDVSKFIDKTLGAERTVLGQRDVGPDLRGDNYGRNDGERMMADITSGPVTPEAQKWDGWGTALKPAMEPIVMARKPFKGTVAANVLEHGTGALNIDACRISATDPEAYAAKGASVIGLDSNRNGVAYGEWAGAREDSTHSAGRFPANVILDESQAAALDEQSGITRSAVRKPSGKDDRGVANTNSSMVMRRHDTTERGVADSGGASRFFKTVPTEEPCAILTETAQSQTEISAGSATPAPNGTASVAKDAGELGDTTQSRFFYCAKAPTSERPKVNGVAHATVKPLRLMRYLVKLVTPSMGTVLDPFAGSGTTVEACILEGFHYIAIEREAEYLPLIDARIDRAVGELL